MSTSPEAPESLGEFNSRMAWLSPILVHLGVARMEASLDGGGDSGDLNGVTYYGSDDKELDSAAIEEELGAISVKGGQITALSHLHDSITQDACDEGNWYDNEGGSVSSSYNVSVDGIFTEYVSISYNDPDDYDYDDDEDEEPEDDELDDDEGLSL